jgi:small subunit ribosomal protein S17
MSDTTNNEENVTASDATTPAAPVEETTVVESPVEGDATALEATTPERAAPVVTAPVVKAARAVAAVEDDTRTNPRKVREGIVISDKMDMTLVVAVNERVSHPRYGKTVQRTKKLYVHDEKNDAKVGDRVRVQETRPLSKLKRWRLTEVVERAR